MNNISIVGRLVRDPETRDAGQSSVCKFTVAVDRAFKNAQGDREADFFPCEAWGKTGEFVQQWFKKGEPVAVTGSVHIRSYDDRDGVRRKAVDVRVSQVSFVPQPAKGRGDQYGDGSDTGSTTSWIDQARAAAQKQDEFIPAPTDNDLPFDF